MIFLEPEKKKSRFWLGVSVVLIFIVGLVGFDNVRLRHIPLHPIMLIVEKAHPDWVILFKDKDNRPCWFGPAGLEKKLRLECKPTGLTVNPRVPRR